MQTPKISMQPRPLTLADGTVVDLAPGDVLPDGLPDDFTFFHVPEDVIAGMKDAHVFVATTMKQCREGVAMFKDDERRSQFVCACANRSIAEFLPRHDAVYARVRAGGDAKAAKEWGDFCTDCTIVLSHRLARGATLRVLLDPPKGMSYGGQAALVSLCYSLRAPGARAEKKRRVE